MNGIPSQGTAAALALLLAAAGLGLLPGPARRPGGVRRRRRITPGTRRTAFAGAGLAGAGLLLGLPWWLSLPAGAAGAVVVRRLPVRPRPPDAADLRRVALLLDLLATCVESGMPAGPAISAVLEAESPTDGTISGTFGSDTAAAPADRTTPRGTAAMLPGRPPEVAEWPSPGRPTVHAVLAEVAALLALGADPSSAWRAASRHPLVEPLAGAAVRSALGGVRMASAVRQLAADLRSRCRTLSERSAARAGVAMTAPLALCFLPAFVCLGLAPVVIGLLSTLRLW